MSPSFTNTYCYLRKSRADGEETVEEVLSKHERIIQEYAVRTWNAELPQSRILREVQSGETISSRPVMRQLIEKIKEKEVEAVLVVDLQRLSRGDLLDVGTLSQLFELTGCLILTPQKSYCLKDEYDRRFFEMELMHGNDYLEYTKKIMGRGREQSAREGNYVGSRRPFGYERIFVNKRPTLAIVPEEAEIIRLIFELYTGPDRLGPYLIASRLNEMGLHPQRADKWTQDAVRSIIINPLYIGKILWNRRKTEKEYRNGEIVTTRNLSEDFILSDGKHEPIISREIWDRANEIRKTRTHPPARRDRSKLVNPLAGLMRCSVCGKAMSYKLCYDHKYKTPLPPIFICTTMGCETRGSTVSDTMSALEALLRKTAGELEVEEARQETPFDPTEYSRQIYMNQIAEMEKQRERLYDFLERGVYDEETFLKRNASLRQKIEEAQARLSEIHEKEKTADETAAFGSTLQRCIESINNPSSSAESVNQLLKEILSRIIYKRAKTTRFKKDNVPLELELIFK